MLILIGQERKDSGQHLKVLCNSSTRLLPFTFKCLWAISFWVPKEQILVKIPEEVGLSPTLDNLTLSLVRLEPAFVLQPFQKWHGGAKTSTQLTPWYPGKSHCWHLIFKGTIFIRESLHFFFNAPHLILWWSHGGRDGVAPLKLLDWVEKIFNRLPIISIMSSLLHSVSLRLGRYKG